LGYALNYTNKENIIVKKTIIIVSILLFILSGCAYDSPMDQERMEEIFIEDYELLRIVVDYFIKSGHENIYIHHTGGPNRMNVGGRDIEIDEISPDANYIDLNVNIEVSLGVFIENVRIWWIGDYVEIEYTEPHDVIRFLENRGYRVYSSSIDPTKALWSGGDIIIEDADVIYALSALIDQGYQAFVRSNNIIHFQRSTMGRHFGSGIAYSIDGVEPNYGVNPRDPLYGSAASPTQIMYLTKLEPLSRPNWFYYEEDFREWRIRYQ